MNRSLQKRTIFAAIGFIVGVLLISYTAYQSSMIIESDMDLKIREIFSGVAEAFGFIARHFTIFVITFIIMGYAISLMRKSRANTIGFFAGLGMTLWIIGMNTIGVIPEYSLTPSEVSFGWILLYSILSVAVGFGFLYIMESLAGERISGVIVAFMVAAALSSFYLYYSSSSGPFQIYLLAIAPAVFVGGCFFEILIRNKEKK